MGEQQPITVVIPTLNEEPWIRGAVESAAAGASEVIVVDLVRRLRRCGPLAFPAAHAVTSARRWEERGFLRTTLLNWLVVALGSVGFPRRRLARLYGVRA